MAALRPTAVPACRWGSGQSVSGTALGEAGAFVTLDDLLAAVPGYAVADDDRHGIEWVGW